MGLLRSLSINVKQARWVLLAGCHAASIHLWRDRSQIVSTTAGQRPVPTSASSYPRDFGAAATWHKRSPDKSMQHPCVPQLFRPLHYNQGRSTTSPSSAHLTLLFRSSPTCIAARVGQVTTGVKGSPTALSALRIAARWQLCGLSKCKRSSASCAGKSQHRGALDSCSREALTGPASCNDRYHLRSHD